MNPKKMSLQYYILISTTIPSNNFAENPRKFPGILPGNFRRFLNRKIWRKCRQLFQGISRNPFRGTRSEEFLVTNSRNFLVTNSADKICGNSREFQRKVLQNQVLGISWELFPRFSQEFLRNILKCIQHIPEQIH